MSTAFFLSPPFPSNPNNSNSSQSNSYIFISSIKTLSPNPLNTPRKPHSSFKPLRVLPFKTSNTHSINNNEVQSPNLNFSLLSEPLKTTDKTVKMPTAPWMRGPLLLPSSEVLDLSRIRKKKKTGKGDEDGATDRNLTDKISGGRGKQAMRKIVESITKLQDLSNSKESQKGVEEFEFRVPLERVCEDEDSTLGARVPWEKVETIVFRRMKKEKVVTAAELSLPETVLKRLRSNSAKMTQWVKVKKAGVTQVAVDEIKNIWRKNELAMLKFDLPLCRNMDRAREIVEIKTGGLVVWRKKDALVVYRGCNYGSTSKDLPKLHSGRVSSEDESPSEINLVKSEDVITISNVETKEIIIDGKDRLLDSLPTYFEDNLSLQSVSGTLYEREADRLLDGLGPRFIDWWWPKPLPVDADLLPEVVPGFMTPFRRCPPYVRPTLADDELTYLRKLARHLPTHFALGRNTKLQGLAAAIIKLWEKSLIAKIAVKWGIPNTNNEQMAWELKRLTGGVLILRNKFFIIFYRGKDFIPTKVANLIVDRETELKRCQFQEEGARWKAIKSFYVTDKTIANTSAIGTFSEFQDIQTKYGLLENGNKKIDVQIQAEKERLEKELRKQKRKLFLLKLKIERSAKVLSKLNSEWRPGEQIDDQEMITEEERQGFRKIGLKMDKTLVLGRRGVFDGVIGSVHQHWKHREVVKVITMQRIHSQVIDTARLLEIESGGLLIAIDKLQKGHAIILYRGKNYRRPLKLQPENLLTKRAALQRSLEMQRIGSLKFFAYQRQRIISDLNCKLRNLLRRNEEITPRESWNP